MRNPRGLDWWLDRLAGWPFLVLLVVVAAVADLAFGPVCLSPDCPNGSHPTATFVVVAAFVLFAIWLLVRLVAAVGRAASERRNRR